MTRFVRRTGSLAALCLVAATVAAAQHQHETHAPATTASGWAWTLAGNLFAGLNRQERKFADQTTFESQNWLMADATRRLGAGRLTFGTMASLEAFTLKDLGSPQAFQTGETWEGAPLIDYQHPHDLVMALGAAYAVTRHAGELRLAAALVGAPALGPPPFMHRPSAAENPQVPLAHHQQDSTHVASSVFTAGLFSRGVGVEASWFRGREPDEQRADLDIGRPDSWAVRVSAARGPWSAQVSGGRLHTPEVIEPQVNVTRLTASIGYQGTTRRPIAWLTVWGRNHDLYGHEDSYLGEATWRATPRWSVYGRAESVVKNILTAGGLHPPGFRHPHVFSRVGAVTAGAVRDIAARRGLLVGVGADVTGYRVPGNLLEAYGSPASVHAFVRVRGERGRGPHID